MSTDSERLDEYNVEVRSGMKILQETRGRLARLLDRIVKWVFCPHEKWSDGNRINKNIRLGLVEHVCLHCGKTIYREPYDPPISKLDT